LPIFRAEIQFFHTPTMFHLKFRDDALGADWRFFADSNDPRLIGVVIIFKKFKTT